MCVTKEALKRIDTWTQFERPLFFKPLPKYSAPQIGRHIGAVLRGLSRESPREGREALPRSTARLTFVDELIGGGTKPPDGQELMDITSEHATERKHQPKSRMRENRKSGSDLLLPKFVASREDFLTPLSIFKAPKAPSARSRAVSRGGVRPEPDLNGPSASANDGLADGAGRHAPSDRQRGLVQSGFTIWLRLCRAERSIGRQRPMFT